MRAITLTPAERRVMQTVIELGSSGPVFYPHNAPEDEAKAIQDLLALGLLEHEVAAGPGSDTLLTTDIGIRVLEDQAVAA